MADPVSIPCVLMRGGTSRAAFFLRSDLPADPGLRDAVLIAAMGAGHELQVDGIGGGNPVTSKAAIATAVATPGTLAAALAGSPRPPPIVDVEHPSGRLPVRLATRPGDGLPVAGVVRTARRLFEGRVLIREADLVAPCAAA